jgi:hypothetical protein
MAMTVEYQDKIKCVTHLSCPTNSTAHDNVAVDVDAGKTFTIDKTTRGLLSTIGVKIFHDYDYYALFYARQVL